MAATLLSIVQAAMIESGLNSPTVAIGASDLLTQQFVSLVKADAADLYRAHDWTTLQKLWVVNVASTVNTTGNITNNSAVITNIPSTAALAAGTFAISADGIPQAARIKTVDSLTQVTMDMVSTATTVGLAIQFAKDTYALPTDFDHYIGETWWDRSNRWMLIGPDSPQIYEYLVSGIVPSGPRRRWREVGATGSTWRIWPPPFANNDGPAALSFEYVSTDYVLHIDGTTGSSFTADTDECLIGGRNGRALVLGAKWRYAQIKGFPMAASLQSEYVDFVDREKARNGGMPDLYMGRQLRPYLISLANVPDGNWPG